MAAMTRPNPVRRRVRFLPSLSPGVLGLHLLHHLLAEAADLGGAGDSHVLGRLVLAGDTVERAARLLVDRADSERESDTRRSALVTVMGNANWATVIE